VAGLFTATPAPVRAETGGATHFVFYDNLDPCVTAGMPCSFYVLAEDAQGEIMINFSDGVHFTSSDPLAILPADYVYQWGDLGDHGGHEFNFIFRTAGPQTLYVTDISSPSITGILTNIYVSPGPATSLTVSDLPASTVVGAETPFRVTLKDEFGNLATNYTGTVGFTSTDGSATLPDSYTFNAGDAGMHTFTVVFASDTLQTVTVTDAANASLHASATTNVMPAGGDFYVNCNSATAGVATPCWVNAQYSDYLVNTSYTGTIHFTSSDSNAAKPVDYTFQSTDQGMAPVFYPTFYTAGSQTLTVTDTDNSAITGTSAGIVISHAGWDHLGLSPSSATIAAGGSHAYTARGFDAYGNSWDATSDTTFTIDSGTPCPAHSCTSTVAGTHTVTGKDGWQVSTATLHVTPAAATHLSVGTFNPYPAGVSHSVTVKAFDAYGNVATGYLGTIHFTSSDTKATLPADYTFTSADKGVHTFSLALVLKTAGSQWVRATDKTTASITGAQTVTVTPGAAKTLSVGTFNPFPAGSTHSVTVKALDAYGNVATAYLGTIHFTSSDTKATLPADYTFTASDAGVHTFSLALVLKTASSQWVRATDKATASITGAQSVTVTPGAAKTLSVGTFNPFPADSTHSVTVKALDAYGNIATAYLGTIHFTSSDTKATLPADYTFTAADKGVHTFSLALVLKTAGSQWVRATDKATASITGAQTVTVT
jgi:hypothetical protein